MFPKWSKADTKIARFMQNLDPRKVYTEKEMNNLRADVGFSKSNSIETLTNIQSGVSNGFGIIIKKTNNNYQLYSELVSSFEKYF